jgi:hypothetical protein
MNQKKRLITLSIKLINLSQFLHDYQPLKYCIVTIYRDTSLAQHCISLQLTRQNVTTCVPRRSSCSNPYRDWQKLRFTLLAPGQFPGHTGTSPSPVVASGNAY